MFGGGVAGSIPMKCRVCLLLAKGLRVFEKLTRWCAAARESGMEEREKSQAAQDFMHKDTYSTSYLRLRFIPYGESDSPIVTTSL